MSEEEENTNLSFWAPVVAAGLFVARFIPFYEYNAGIFGAGKLSINQLTELCSYPLVAMAPGCQELDIINPVMWIAIIGLIGYYGYKLWESKNDEGKIK